MPRPDCPLGCTATSELLVDIHFAAIEGTEMIAGYEVRACAACGLVAGRGDFDQASLDRYYARLSKYGAAAGAVDPPWDVARFEHVARWLGDAGVTADASLLELGSTSGGFLRAAAAAGFRRARGYEPDPASARRAREAGLDVAAGAFADAGGGAAVDLLVALHVVEHVCDLGAFLDFVDGAVRPDGRIFLEVPDASRFDSVPAIPYQQFSVEHINFFTPTSLAAVLARRGFGVEASYQTVRAVGRTLAEPVLGMLFRRGARPAPVAAPDDLASLRRYLSRSAADEAPIRAHLAQVARDPRPLVVWSVGTQALRLLADSPLGEAPIVAFVDGNPRYHGLRLLGRPIVPPSALVELPHRILIATSGSAPAIERVIREELRLPNEVVSLAPAGG